LIEKPDFWSILQDLELPASQHSYVFAINGAKFDAMESKQQQLQQKKKKLLTLLSLFLQNPEVRLKLRSSMIIL
jgi:hypothetical protein